MMTDADGAKVKAKKEAKNRQMQTEKRLTTKDSQKNHALLQLIRNPVCL